MNTPHYVLFAEARRRDPSGRWRFVLQSVDGSDKFEAEDSEPDVSGERLELLTVVRGLEAIDRPARVTLVTQSRYVNRGLEHGLQEWRRNGWTWERFGHLVPIKNRDLWQRVDRALCYHDVECRRWRFDGRHGAPRPKGAVASTAAARPCPFEEEPYRVRRALGGVERMARRGIERAAGRIAQLWTRRSAAH